MSSLSHTGWTNLQADLSACVRFGTSSCLKIDSSPGSSHGQALPRKRERFCRNPCPTPSSPTTTANWQPSNAWPRNSPIPTRRSPAACASRPMRWTTRTSPACWKASPSSPAACSTASTTNSPSSPTPCSACSTRTTSRPCRPAWWCSSTARPSCRFPPACPRGSRSIPNRCTAKLCAIAPPAPSPSGRSRWRTCGCPACRSSRPPTPPPPAPVAYSASR